MNRSLATAAMACCSFALGISAAVADVRVVSGPVAVTPENSMFGAADVPGARLSISLVPQKYVEEEYFVSGTAAAYEHGADGPKARTPDLPYTTRIIVRRPADPARFSGVVHFEPMHPTQGYQGHWLVMRQYLMPRGDIYVAVGLGDASKGWSGSPSYRGQKLPVGTHSLAKWISPSRYRALSWPQEEGIRFQVMGDIGRKLRSADADNPLKGLTVKAMLVGGWSYTGSIQRTYINEGFHDRIRLPDGRPVFDGYLVGVSSRWNNPGYLPLYNDEPFVDVGDPRRELRDTDARVIEFLTEAEVELGNGPQKPDSDAKLGGHRLYELGGVIHVASLADPQLSALEEPYTVQLLNRGYPSRMISAEPVFSCPLPQSDVPHGAYVRAAVDNLRHWVLEGTPPPRANPLRWQDGTMVRDSTGNPVGGIRAAELELPLARYGRYSGTLEKCKEERPYPWVFLLRLDLSRSELLGRYQSPERYLDSYDRAIDLQVAQHWLLPEDALRLKAKTREDVLRQF